MKKVVRIADVKNDNTLITPSDVLKDALEDIESGKRSPNKLMVIMLTDIDYDYNTNWYCSNLKTSEIISLLEIQKMNFLKTLLRNEE